MGKCLKCGVTITDNTVECPLCKNVLDTIPNETYTDHYPNILEKKRKEKTALNIFRFIAIAAEFVFVLINLAVNPRFLWCIITGAGLFYVYTTIRMASKKNIDIRRRFIFQASSAVAFLIVIDYLTGFNGWSICLVIPIAVLFLDMTVFILILAHRNYFETYIWSEILFLAFSIVPLIGFIFYPKIFVAMRLIAFACSVMLFLGTIIIGGNKSRAELIRRFHIK